MREFRKMSYHKYGIHFVSINMAFISYHKWVWTFSTLWIFSFHDDCLGNWWHKTKISKYFVKVVTFPAIYCVMLIIAVKVSTAARPRECHYEWSLISLEHKSKKTSRNCHRVIARIPSIWWFLMAWNVSIFHWTGKHNAGDICRGARSPFVICVYGSKLSGEFLLADGLLV
jgi:hypothetical protein